MRFTILGFNQKLAIKNNLSISDLLLLQYIMYANGQPNMQHIVDDTEVSYVWLHHSKIQEDLPILNISEGTLRNKLSELKKKDLIQSISIPNKNGKGSKTYYSITTKTMSFINDSNNSSSHAKMTPYNILNTLSNDNVHTNISKDILVSETSSKTNNRSVTAEFKFGSDVLDKPKKKTNVSVYDECLEMINDYTNNIALVKTLTKFVSGKKEICSKNRYKFYSSTIKNYLDELSDTFGDDDDKKVEAVKLSIRYNYTTKVMIPNSPKTYNTVKNIENISENDYEKFDHVKSERSF